MKKNQIVFYSFAAASLLAAACGLENSSEKKKPTHFQINYTPTPRSSADDELPANDEPTSAPLPAPTVATRSTPFAPAPSAAPAPPAPPAPASAATAAPASSAAPSAPSPRVPSPRPTRRPWPWPFFTPRATATPQVSTEPTRRPVNPPAIAPPTVAPPAVVPRQPAFTAPPVPSATAARQPYEIVAPSLARLQEMESTSVPFSVRVPRGEIPRRRARCQYEPCKLRMSFSGLSSLKISAPEGSAGAYSVVLEAVDSNDALVTFEMKVDVLPRSLN